MNIFFRDRTVYNEKSTWKLLKRVGFALIILLALAGWTSSGSFSDKPAAPLATENFEIEFLEPRPGASYAKCLPILAHLKHGYDYSFDALIEEDFREINGQPARSLIKWDIKADGVTVGTKETAITVRDVALNFKLPKAGDNIQLSATAILLVENMDGSNQQIISIGTAEPITIKAKECKAGVVIYYRGQFADEFWTWTEAGTMLLTEVTAPPNGSYSGAGNIALTTSGFGEMDGGTCVLSPPAMGISPVMITGELDDESGKFDFDFGFEPSGDPGSASMNCTVGDLMVTLGVEPYRPMDPSIFGITKLDFMLPITTRNITVSEGFATQVPIPRPGTGVITITTVLLDEPPSANAYQPDTQTVADFWQILISIFDKVAG